MLASLLCHSVSKLTLNKTGSSWLLFAYSLEKVFCSHTCTSSSYFDFPLRNPVDCARLLLLTVLSWLLHTLTCGSHWTFRPLGIPGIHWRCVTLVLCSQCLLISLNIPAGQVTFHSPRQVICQPSKEKSNKTSAFFGVLSNGFSNDRENNLASLWTCELTKNK